MINLRNKKYIFPAVVVFIVLILIVLVRKSQADIDRIRVITDESTWGMISQEDTIFGLNYEMVRDFADINELELEITIENNLQKCLLDLQDGKVDLVASLVPNTLSVSEQFFVSQSILQSRLILVQLSDSAHTMVNAQYELKDQKISMSKGSPFLFRIRALSDEIAAEIVVEEVDLAVDQLMKSVAEGTISQTVCPEYMTAYYHAKFPQLDFSIPLGFIQEYVWICRKDDVQLIEKLNKFLESYLISSEYLSIKSKYLNN